MNKEVKELIEEIKEIWLNDLIETAKEKVEKYMNEVDEVVTENKVKPFLERGKE